MDALHHPLSRRAFVVAGAAGAAGLAALGDPLAAAEASRRRVRRARIPLAREGRFTQGVASGQPATNAITLWTRLGEVDRDARIRIEIATDRAFSRVVHREERVARESANFTLSARVRTNRLRPGRQYYYRFETCDTSSRVGAFRTARPADSREPVRIGFFSCQDFQEGFYTAHAGLADEPDLDLVVCLGDYIYEKATFAEPVRDDTTAPDRETQTLAEYRRKYALYHSDPNLLAVRANTPLMAIWDDHEVENDYAGDEAGEGTRNRRVPFPRRRANGYRAFFEHMPRIRATDRDRIYGSRVFGGNLELFLLDQRQYRDDQPCLSDGTLLVPVCSPEERADPGRTLLGSPQKEWLRRGLARSRSTWKVVANQVMMMALDVPARNPVNPDAWDGYEAERRELLDFVRTQGIENVSFVTGDIHTFFAGNVTPSGREGVPAVDGSPVATEFVGGSITSAGIADTLGREQGRDAAAFPADAGVLANNPHMKFSNQSFKGYAVLEARPDELLVEFRVPATVKAPTSTISTLQGFRVARGDPRVQPAGAVLERRPPRLPPLPVAAAQTADCRSDDALRGRSRRAPRFTG